MSRAFVKESDGRDGSELPDRAVSPHRNLVTPAGLAQIDDEIRQLREALSVARAAEDRAAAAGVERDLRYWTRRRLNAELVPTPGPADKVRFGARVVLQQPDGQSIEYQIAGEDEADPARRCISYVSPLAQALLGAAVGDSVDLSAGTAEIVAIR